MLDPRIEQQAEKIKDLKQEIELLKMVCKKLANYIDVVFYPRYLRTQSSEKMDLDQVLNEVKKVLKE